MSDAQRRRIEAVLHRSCPFEWAPGTTVEQVRTDLATLIPTVIHYRSLEEIGLTADQPFQDAQDAQDASPAGGRSRTESAPRAHADPFAGDPMVGDPFAGNSPNDAPPAQPPPAPAASTPLPSTPVQWWHRDGEEENHWSDSGESAAVQPTNALLPSIGARLRQLCEALDLAISIRGGQLVILTREEAERLLDRRIYDVTPLLGHNPVGPFRRDSSVPFGQGFGGGMGYGVGGEFGRNSGDRDSSQLLIETIEATASPDTWERLGGPSTMQIFATGTRTWLVVSTTTEVHWQLQSLLDNLNR